VDVPGSEKCGFGTQANGINNFLEVVGVYTDPLQTNVVQPTQVDVYQSITEPSSGSKRVLYSWGSPTCARSLSSSIVIPRPGSVGSSR
jgi:hypothetical protein